MFFYSSWELLHTSHNNPREQVGERTRFYDISVYTNRKLKKESDNTKPSQKWHFLGYFAISSSS